MGAYRWERAEGALTPGGLLLGDDDLHLLHAVAGWVRVLLGGNGHPHLGAAEAAPVLQLHLAEIPGGRWLGDRRGKGTQQSEPGPDEDHGHDDGEDDLDQGHGGRSYSGPQ